MQCSYVLPLTHQLLWAALVLSMAVGAIAQRMPRRQNVRPERLP
jgi:hypothetical protein